MALNLVSLVYIEQHWIGEWVVGAQRGTTTSAAAISSAPPSQPTPASNSIFTFRELKRAFISSVAVYKNFRIFSCIVTSGHVCHLVIRIFCCHSLSITVTKTTGKAKHLKTVFISILNSPKRRNWFEMRGRNVCFSVFPRDNRTRIGSGIVFHFTFFSNTRVSGWQEYPSTSSDATKAKCCSGAADCARSPVLISTHESQGVIISWIERSQWSAWIRTLWLMVMRVCVHVLSVCGGHRAADHNSNLWLMFALFHNEVIVIINATS